MLDVDVIDDTAAARGVLDPIRAKVLVSLMEPGSATTVASALGISRQKANYHVRALEEMGLVELVDTRPKRGLSERVLIASARSYVLSPSLLGSASPDDRTLDPLDRLSARYLLALTSRLIREVGWLVRKADAANKKLATLSIDTDICFASAADQAAFTAELVAAIADLAGRYHNESAPGGRWHRVLVAAHPRPPIEETS